MKDFEKLARAYALKNALSHEGKAILGSVISSLFHEGFKKEDMKSYGKKFNDIVNDVNKLSFKEQEKEYEKLKDIVSERKGREGLEELPNVPKSGVVMRFAPSPSGPLHIGHAMTACLSFLYVKKYGGKFYVRIEDTNPENIYPQAYKMIEEESKWLFENKSKFVIQSDRMKIYYSYAEKLLKKNAVYVCTCSQDSFKQLMEKMKPCPCRELSVKENLSRWKKMLDKKGFKESDAVLRFKTPFPGVKHKNPAMRDFPLARINTHEHPRQGKKYKVWPLMNLAVSVDDIEMKMTHIIRAKDHRDNAERQKYIFKALGKKYPWSEFLGRIHFKDIELSSSQFRKDIELGKYNGWDDKRIPTIASLKKQGYKPQSFWKFSEQVGISENDKTFDKEEYFKLLDSFNRE